MCACLRLHLFFHSPFLNVCAGNVEFTKDIDVLVSSSDTSGCIAGKDQNHDFSEILDGARCSECLNEVLSLTTLNILCNN